MEAWTGQLFSKSFSVPFIMMVQSLLPYSGIDKQVKTRNNGMENIFGGICAHLFGSFDSLS
jgi:hypothetical protein